MRVVIWNGQHNRLLSLYRPCVCGCDERNGKHGVGYISASDGDGRGFTLWIEEEKTFKRLATRIPMSVVEPVSV